MRSNVPLAPRTTLELGGPADLLVEAKDRAGLVEALRFAKDRFGEDSKKVLILGGGSNVVISDRGFRGLVIAIGHLGIERAEEPGHVLLTAQAGEPWDALVERTVNENLQGLECLSGIPGLVGAAPIQNVGAYGQEISQSLRYVEVLDRSTLRTLVLDAAACDFSYRNSRFKKKPGRFVVLSVTFALKESAPASVLYPELERALGEGPRTLQRVRNTVLGLRRRKSMVRSDDDPNRRSAGSFFTNPIVPRDFADQLAADIAPLKMPRFDVGDEMQKLAAAWLIEQAGFKKGLIQGAVGLSTNHCLALINRGGGTSSALMALATKIQVEVKRRFGVTLEPEPVLVGDL